MDVFFFYSLTFLQKGPVLGDVFQFSAFQFWLKRDKKINWILTRSSSDTFQFWHFQILTLSNSDTFQFWHFPILTLTNSDTFQFWHFPILTLTISDTSNSDTFQLWNFLICSDTFQFWHFPILTLSNSDTFQSQGQLSISIEWFALSKLALGKERNKHYIWSNKVFCEISKTNSPNPSSPLISKFSFCNIAVDSAY